MSSHDLKRLALARDIEDAFKNYLGTDSFPTEEWPAVALALADVIVGTFDAYRADGYLSAGAAELVKEHGHRLARLEAALADLVGI